MITLWQKKAWIDAAGEKEVLNRMIKPYTLAVNRELGYEAEYLLTEDRGPGHHLCGTARLAFNMASKPTINPENSFLRL